MSEHYLTVEEGVAFGEDMMPEPIFEPDIRTEIDIRNDWLEYSDIDDQALFGRAVELAAKALPEFVRWLVAHNHPQTIVERVLVTQLFLIPETLGHEASISAIAQRLGLNKQRVHAQAESFRLTFGFERRMRTPGGRGHMRQAMLASWARRKAADGKGGDR